MKFDGRLITGIFVGLVVGLHYYSTLTIYVPLLMVITLILVLRTIHH
jgi:hypothetical protein